MHIHKKGESCADWLAWWAHNILVGYNRLTHTSKDLYILLHLHKCDTT